MLNSLVSTWLTKRSVSAALSVGALLCITSGANAQLISYEGFNYSGLTADQSLLQPATAPNAGLGTSGNTYGTGDSFGWAGGWSTSAGTNQYVATSLTYNNGASLVVDGGAERTGMQHNQVIGSTTAQLQRQFALLGNGGTSNTLGSIAANYGGVLWMSFLYQNLVNDPLQWGGGDTGGGTNGFAAAWVGFQTGATIGSDGSSQRNGGSQLEVGQGNTPTAGVGRGIQIGNLNGNNNMLPVDTDESNYGPAMPADLIVMRLTVDNTSANDQVDLWLNPVIGAGSLGTLGTPTVSYTTNLSSVNGIRLQAGNQNGQRTNAVFVTDEYRLGADFYSVTPTPEPSTIALLGVALSGLWLSIRRNRRS